MVTGEQIVVYSAFRFLLSHFVDKYIKKIANIKYQKSSQQTVSMQGAPTERIDSEYYF